MKSPSLCLALLALLSTPAAAKDPTASWPAWRGPLRNGLAAPGEKPVTEWSSTRNILWQVNVPGRGHSSPTIVGPLVVLTTADEGQPSQSVLAYDRATGRPRWATRVHEGGFAEEIHKKNTHASPTVASDGDHLYAVFCNEDAVKITKLDLAGERVWTKIAGPFEPKLYRFGYAPSPVLYKDSIIVASDFEAGYLASFSLLDGKERWRTPRQSQHVSYSSPIVAQVAGRDQLLISGREKVASYDPRTGKTLWSTPGTTMATCGTMIWDDQVVYASGGYPKQQTIAVAADGSGKILWKNRQKCYEQSMLIHAGYLYAFTDQGIAYCWRAKDGEVQWKQRLEGPVSASPVLAAGKIYATNERGKTFVFEASPKAFRKIAENQLGDSSFASPTIVDSKIYLRHASGRGKSRRETLYCIGKPGRKS